MTLKVEELDMFLRLSGKETLREFFRGCHIGDTAALGIMTTHQVKDWMVEEIFNRLGVENAFRFICVGSLKEFFNRFAIIGGKAHIYKKSEEIIEELINGSY